MPLTCTGSDPSEWSGTHIDFTLREMSPSGRTGIWDVLTKQGGTLGEVKWYSRWRKYSFFPGDGCLFEQTCLREIADFIEERTKEQRTGI